MNQASSSEIDVLSPDNGYIYVWGSVHYHDGFQPGRYTDFCHRYNRRRLIWQNGVVKIRRRYGRHHHHGNDAT
jgi:hypothetical protein